MATRLPARAEPVAFTKPRVSPSPSPQQFTAMGKAIVTLASPALAEEEQGVHSPHTCR